MGMDSSVDRDEEKRYSKPDLSRGDTISISSAPDFPGSRLLPTRRLPLYNTAMEPTKWDVSPLYRSFDEPEFVRDEDARLKTYQLSSLVVLAKDIGVFLGSEECHV